MWQTFGAAVLTVIGVACLYGSWRDWIASHRWPVAIGWALLTASIWLWSRAAGAEFGTTLAIFVPALLAWVFVLHNIELRQQRHR
ncbi:MAG TPA: hypothetical protein VKB34_00605, partial [Povalibacter sp.]|nr:hypothetical protein [Povalibacter sp.]